MVQYRIVVVQYGEGSDLLSKTQNFEFCSRRTTHTHRPRVPGRRLERITNVAQRLPPLESHPESNTTTTTAPSPQRRNQLNLFGELALPNDKKTTQPSPLLPSFGKSLLAPRRKAKPSQAKPSQPSEVGGSLDEWILGLEKVGVGTDPLR